MLATLLVAAPPGQASRTVSRGLHGARRTACCKLTGHGYGHGHGMSQYGAQGAALQGLTHRQILAFYYPGTTLGTATGHDPGADHGRHRQRRPGACRPAACGCARWAAARRTPCRRPPASTTWRLRTVSGKHGPRLRQRHLAHLQARRQGAAPATPSSTAPARVDPARRRARRGPTAARCGSAAANTVNVLEHRRLRQGRGPARDADLVGARRRARAGRRRAHVRRLRPRRAPAPAATTPATPPPARCTAGVGAEDSRSNAAVVATANQVLTLRRQAGVHPVRLEQRRLALGRQPALPGRQGRPVRRATAATRCTPGTPRSPRRRSRRRGPRSARCKRVLVTQRDGHGDWYGRVEKMILDGTQGQRHPHRRHLPVEVRAALELVPVRLGRRRRRRPSRAPTPAPADARRRSPLRWQAIGGASSVVGRPTARGVRRRRRSRPRLPARPDLLPRRRRRARALRPGAQGLPARAAARPRGSASRGPVR